MTQRSGSLSNAEEIDMKMMFFSHDLNVVINKPNHQNNVRKYVPAKPQISLLRHKNCLVRVRKT